MSQSLPLTHPLWVQLGLTLVHFLWQGALAAMAVGVALWLLRHRTAGGRYVVCGLGLVAMAACPAITLLYIRSRPLPMPVVIEPGVSAAGQFRTPTGGAARRADRPQGSTASGIGSDSEHIEATSARLQGGLFDADIASTAASDPAPGESAAAHGSPKTAAAGQSGESVPAGSGEPNGAQRWLVWGLKLGTIFWIVGVAGLSLRLFASWLGLRTLKRSATEPLPRLLGAIVARLRISLCVGRRVRVLASRVVDGPLVFGLLGPVVLLPASVLIQCPPDLLEAMVAHELAHIRRYDLWVNVIQRAIEIVLFYHPAVRWVSDRMRLERELCCDDLAVVTTGRRAEYAEALVSLSQLNIRVAPPCWPRDSSVGRRRSPNASDVFFKCRKRRNRADSGWPDRSGS